MLFKILHGDPSKISTDITPFHAGWCYVTHSGEFYVDMNIGTESAPNNQRIKLNAEYADKLRYVQNEEPIDAPEGTLWIDLDAEGVVENGTSVFIDTTLTQSGQAADAKAVGDALATKQPVGNYASASDVANLNTLVGDTAVATQITNAVSQKSQVQIITWESDD